MKKIAILQSNYIPWKGYFDLIAAVDEFILFDDVQYTKNDWRNRNKIKTPSGVQWITVPVVVKGKFGQKINETLINGNYWSTLHWKTIIQNYRHAPYFYDIALWLEPIFLHSRFTYISELNRCLIDNICRYLNIKTKISNSNEYNLIEGKTDRLVDLCVQAGATEYISGPSAHAYINEEIFFRKNINITWFDYKGYKEYPQLWGEFVHNVSILDLLFNCGKESSHYMKCVLP